ncbi:MAG: hypothetical protein QTN59_21065 [Candidatus Electrothrix communis]|nr:MAG: hypothetical protein QTN59_21065 [Candidatus Electrothrix communis]
MNCPYRAGTGISPYSFYAIAFSSAQVGLLTNCAIIAPTISRAAEV